MGQLRPSRDLVEDGFDPRLLGLFDGATSAELESADVPATVTRIVIYSHNHASAFEDEACLREEVRVTVVAAGFVDFAILWRAEVFAGAPQSSSAAKFGTQGINFRARKPANEAELEAALAALSCGVSSGGSEGAG